MAIEDILQALDEELRQECQDIFDKAKAEIDAIMAEGEAEAERIREAKLERMRKRVESETAALMYSARLGYKNEVIRAREVIVDEAFAKALEDLAGVRGNGRYKAVMEALLKEGVQKVSGTPVIHCDPADSGLTSDCLNCLSVGGDVVSDITCVGGLVITDADARVRIINTLEERLERAKSRLRMEVAEQLFSAS
ncbi:MAG: V-type ATP synthase subunit E [Candidatus Geothermincolia bacterium]